MKAAGKDWEVWYSTTRDALLARRNKDGVWGDAKASTFDTAYALIILVRWLNTMAESCAVPSPTDDQIVLPF